MMISSENAPETWRGCGLLVRARPASTMASALAVHPLNLRPAFQSTRRVRLTEGGAGRSRTITLLCGDRRRRRERLHVVLVQGECRGGIGPGLEPANVEVVLEVLE